MSERALSDGELEAGPEGRPRWRLGLMGAGLALALMVILHLIGALQGVEQTVLRRLPARPSQALLGIVDVFKCCILSWKALTTMLPAFLLGGAVTAFVPAPVVLRNLGAQANQVRAYTVAAVSGIVLSLCSCNIVPLFVSIYRRGAGIGPAFTFLYAGPAINIVAMVFTVQVIGWRLGVWRAVGVPIIAVLAGIGMALLFRGSTTESDGSAARAVQAAPDTESHRRVWVLFILLLGLVVFGATETGWLAKLLGMLAISAAIAALLRARFRADELRAWADETWRLVKLVVPVLLPAVLVIGAIAAFIDVKLVYRLLGPAPDGSGFLREMRPILVADVFGALMYFPILSEVAFTKAFLKLGMDVGPALAVLLTGAGLSLPGLFIVGRAAGWRKVLVYQGIVIVLTTALAAFFASEVGQYICACMMSD